MTAIAFTFAMSLVGLEGSKLAEITSGLNPGDRVVIGGQDKYQENEEVSPLLTASVARIGDRAGDGRHDRHEGRSRRWRRSLMPKFALRFPYFIIMLCLLVSLVGAVNIAQMPVDLFPKIDMPVVVVATFYNGMPPQQIEADITNTFERFLLSAPISTTANRAR
jgi:hypothetical protein